VNPGQVDFVHGASSELIAQAAQGALISSYNHGTTCHPIESMWNSDKGGWGIRFLEL
jgi:hypothetical protein